MIFNIKFVYNYYFIFILFSLCFPHLDTLKILNYNICGLHPILIDSDKIKDNNKYRIEDIFNESKEFDIVLFQENWIYQDLIRKIMNEHKIIISEKTKFIIKDNSKRSSGLNLAFNSSFNIEYYEESLFSDCNGYLFDYNDCLASKGFVYSLVSSSDYKINIYVTHLDAGSSKNDMLVRSIQLKEISNHIQNIDNDYPVILTGDFNIDYYKDVHIIDEFINENNFTNLRWDNLIETESMIDYVFYRNGKNNLISVIDFGINIALINKSDHLPIEFTIVLEK